MKEKISKIVPGISVEAKKDGLDNLVSNFHFNLILTTDDKLKKQLPPEFHHALGEMNYFKVSYNFFE